MKKRLLMEWTMDKAGRWTGGSRWAVVVWRYQPVFRPPMPTHGWHEVRVGFSTNYMPPAEILDELRRR